MNSTSTREKGLLLLGKIKSLTNDAEIIKDWLLDYQFDSGFVDDSFAWLSCILALKASSEGNFGVGCVLISQEGEIVIEGHNEVFHPYFRSDRHGEMVVINSFEDKFKGKKRLENFALISSLESCPMCLTRLITSGIGRVSYVAPDMTGGMVHRIRSLPEVWIDLSKNQIFDQANCSKRLIDVAFEIFLLNAEELNKKIINRGV